MRLRYYDYVFIVFFAVAFISFSFGFRNSMNAYVILSESNYCDSSDCYRLCKGPGDCLMDEVCCLKQSCNSQQRCNVRSDIGICMPQEECKTTTYEYDLPFEPDDNIVLPELQSPADIERSKAGILLFLLGLTCIVAIGYLYYRNKSEE